MLGVATELDFDLVHRIPACNSHSRIRSSETIMCRLVTTTSTFRPSEMKASAAISECASGVGRLLS